MTRVGGDTKVIGKRVLAPTLHLRELLFQTKVQRQSSLDEDFEKTRTYTYIINMYTCRHVCVVARI